MPRTKASKASDGAASSSAAGDEEDGATKPRRLPPQEYDRLRGLKRSFSQDMYAMAVAHLEAPLEKIRTEGRRMCPGHKDVPRTRRAPCNRRRASLERPRTREPTTMP